MTLIERLDTISKSIESTVEIPEFTIEAEPANEAPPPQNTPAEEDESPKPKRKRNRKRNRKNKPENTEAAESDKADPPSAESPSAESPNTDSEGKTAATTEPQEADTDSDQPKSSFGAGLEAPKSE